MKMQKLKLSYNNEDGLFTQQVEINKNVNVEVYEYLFTTTNVHFSTSLVAKTIVHLIIYMLKKAKIIVL